MKHFIRFLSIPFLIVSFSTSAKEVHFSPHITAGPLVGAGISGVGGQLGITEVFGSNTLYASFEKIDYQYLTDDEEWKTYRVGIQHPLSKEPRIAFQFELGGIDYQGERNLIWRKETRSGSGVSTSGSVVLKINNYLGVRGGLTLNYIDRKNTFLSYSTFSTVHLGVVLYTNFNG
ncbi:hypothetical protein [Vibrio breoganii]|uniref:hypothetical protein n=1 Tax=Vibrio breoganii TaxID=553239 RepID=UPI0021C33CDC|nr:hypothetical protein [Vibrio breoganii]MDN3716962.1 hypothetical protein [Vibrio breoganii]